VLIAKKPFLMVPEKIATLLITSASLCLHLSVLGQVDSLREVKKKETVTPGKNQNEKYFSARSLIVPGVFAFYVGLKPAVKGIREVDKNIMSSVEKNYPDFHTNVADYLMWSPSASIYMMDAFHVKMKHNFVQHLILDAGSILITGGIGYAMRKIAVRIPVYNNKGTEFPSGHTANAFRGAEIIHQELKYSHPVLSYSGYLVATSVGLLRIYNKNHLLTEVLAGAALGLVSTRLTYWIFDKLRKEKRSPVSVNMFF
jgi:membrane-associated phospholipid phosphatase